MQTIGHGGLYSLELIRRLAVPESPRADVPALIEALTPRELEVVGAVARGLKNNAIADHLGVSLETINTHVGNAMDKLAAKNPTQMADGPVVWLDRSVGLAIKVMLALKQLPSAGEPLRSEAPPDRTGHEDGSQSYQ